MRALGLHADVIVLVSRIWQTTCTAVRTGDEGFVIDSPVLPDELDALPGVLEQIGFPVSGLLATHADWDHLLGRLAFPEVGLGCGESTAARLSASPGAVQRGLRDFDDEHYVSRPDPLSLRGVQALPVPSSLALGAGPVAHELELVPTAGHTADGTAFWIPWTGIIVCGDYLSPVEIPIISADGGSAAQYLDTLARLEPLVAGASTVVPGHGAPLEVPDALRVLEEDRVYLEALMGSSGADAPLPATRRTGVQRRLHEQNVTRVEA